MSMYVDDIQVDAFKIPTSLPESDGTLEWKDTTMILVRVRCGVKEGIGYTYGDISIREIIASSLKPVVMGKEPMDVTAIQTAMIKAIRNNGQTGLAMMAVSAIDIALWDAKAKLLDIPLCRLLGQERQGMKIYGSGGFTSYTDDELRSQLSGWVRDGIDAVKIKVGRDMEADIRRVAIARASIGTATALYVDANGAYTVRQAIAQAQLFAAYGVNWLEEPVPSDAVDQLAFIRTCMKGDMRIAAGEYGYGLPSFSALLGAGAVDVLQADATRCDGITGFLKTGHLCEAYHVPLSSHCAPYIHLHAALSLPGFSIAEYFHDHVLIEQTFFDGSAPSRNGQLIPDLSRPGHGLVFQQQAAEPYRVA